ncbi:hypothetical protein JK386_04875 [Nocardioides sp. zg-536]|uniref:Secreted protein n=1 Tax=Nocardioides faecalis TaxID=2803858 RepID=A0A938XZS0_9ACTN|nr:hypothetical protein [Nocardioides faecalis]MBM9459226.1 hypothetical protein [Nocardioides faecalis]QVI59638.1 hypothetical protein KG111_04640 [Nocardioides faecalis]
MSQTAKPQVVPAPGGVPAAAQPGTQPGASTSMQAAPGAQPGQGQVAPYVDTPGLLNRWQLIGMSTAIVFGLLSALLQFSGWQADGRAADDTEQLVRVQEIQSSLLRADALATNTFLAGGLEDPAQRAEYDDAIESVLRLVVAAAEAQPADGNALAALNVEVDRYTTGVAQARDYNRQRYPLGAEYLSGASTALRADALPILAELVEANTERAEDAMGGQHPVFLLLLGLTVAGVLVWLNSRLARHFRRRINKGVAVAVLVVAVVTALSVIGAGVRDTANDSLREDEFAAAVSEATARTAANDAKANESLRLIKRGSGATFEEAWQASSKAVTDSGTSHEVQWNAYVADHDKIVGLDESGRWEEAVELAISPKGSTATLDAFDSAAAKSVTSNSDTAIEELRSGRALALLFSVLTLLLGVAAAVAVARGIGERRKEFA